jgi:hypothetical protein
MNAMEVPQTEIQYTWTNIGSGILRDSNSVETCYVLNTPGTEANRVNFSDRIGSKLNTLATAPEFQHLPGKKNFQCSFFSNIARENYMLIYW